MENFDRGLLEILRGELARQLPEIEANGDWLWAHPETGFREEKTQEYCLKALKTHGISCKTFPGVTGFTAELDSGKPVPVIGIMGEMDSVICFGHPDHDPVTGAAHACGHSIQMAAAMGAFTVLAESGVLEKTGGKVVFLGVPAEECLETDWRLEEIKKGRLHYLGGKPELMYRGAFDGVDLVLNVHSGAMGDGTIRPVGRHNGFLSKTVTFQGKSAHAAAFPDQGINALYMANTALTALNGLRETFRDEDKTRVHAIITRGGESSNAIPETVCLEAQCRANRMEAELEAAERFDRAMGAGAYAFGGQVLIKTQPGYMPYIPTKELDEIAMEVADEILGLGHGLPGPDTAGAEDMGDLNTILPVVQVYVNYMKGSHHAADYAIADRRIYEVSALFLAVFACRLLEHEGKLAKKVKAAHKPMFHSVQEYCAFIDPLFSEKILP